MATKSYIVKYRRFTGPWWSFVLKRAAYLGAGICIGAGIVYSTGARLELNRIYSIESGYLDNWHEFHAFSCERTKANGDAYNDGIQRFNIHTGPSIESLAKHMELVDGIDVAASESWHKPLVVIDYRKNHEICVKHMWDTGGADPDTCFDLYELGER